MDRLSDYPRVACLGKWCSIAYKGTNILAYERIHDRQFANVGMVMADFPGPGLIDSIIDLNIRYEGMPLAERIVPVPAGQDHLDLAKTAHLFPRPSPNYCLSANDQKDDPPYHLYQRRCHRDSKWQRWDVRLHKDAKGGTYVVFRNEATRRCLTDVGEGQAVRLHACNLQQTNQHWSVGKNSAIKNRRTRLCLQTHGSGPHDYGYEVKTASSTCSGDRAVRVYVGGNS